MGKFVEGKPPFGYVRAKGKDATDKPRTLEPDPVRAPIVRRMFDLCLAGNSATKISAIMRAEHPGLLNFDPEWILSALKNRMYAGQMALTAVRPKGYTSTIRRPAEWVPTHEPIVSLETWNAAQHALAGRRSYGAVPRTESKTASWIMRGLARCAICGSMVGAAPNSTTGKHQHPGYYVCRRRLQNRRGGERCMEAPFLRQEDTDAKLANAARKHFGASKAALTRFPPPPKLPDTARFENERAKLYAQRDRLIKFVMMGDRPLELIDRQSKEIEGKLMALDAEERETVVEVSEDTAANRQGAREWVEKVAGAWDAMSAATRRAVIAAMLDRITVGKDGLDIKWADAAAMATRYAQGTLPDLKGEADEPTRPRRPEQRTEDEDPGELVGEE
jgi:hypothetical protein